MILKALTINTTQWVYVLKIIQLRLNKKINLVLLQKDILTLNMAVIAGVDHKYKKITILVSY